MTTTLKIFLLPVLFILNLDAIQSETTYRIGVGIADVTGPPAEINMMGYANPSQESSGIHIRMFSRAFIIGDKSSRVLFISVDSGMTAQIVRIGVLKMLKKTYGDVYNDQNVVISSTHTHSTPGGFLQYVLYAITSKGFVSQSYDALVDGIVRSVHRAHENLQMGRIYYNQGELLDASINRSPTSYLKNPKEERKRYAHDTDKEMFLLRFENMEGKPIGMINWFAVHGTSMNNTNKLISGDNKGYASQLFESAMNNGSLPGKGSFVAAFAQANLGDVSPNIEGPRCLNSGKRCDILTSTCQGKNELCVASGPGRNMLESTRIIGERQYDKAMELFRSAESEVNGPIKSAHQFVDMTNRRVQLDNGRVVKTCLPAMGASFAAGTTDGPGAFDFKQGSTSINGFWTLVRNFLEKPSKAIVKCHHPKPILLSTGEMTFPYEWDPKIVDIQTIQIGNVIAAAVPGEFTTMSGRRLKEAIAKTVHKHSKESIEDLNVVVAGLSNTYSSYITTYEEYQEQRYEAASTIFGPHTLQAYIQLFKELAKNMVSDKKHEAGPSPPNNLEKAKEYDFNTGVVYDGHPFLQDFGYVKKNVKDHYAPGSTVSVEFVAGHPNNNLMTEGTYLTVELFDTKSGQWQIIATDASWDTKFVWKRTSTIFGRSIVTVIWNIPNDVKRGTYRIRHMGHYKTLFTRTIYSYKGKTSTFHVI